MDTMVSLVQCSLMLMLLVIVVQAHANSMLDYWKLQQMQKNQQNSQQSGENYSKQ